MRYMLLAGKTGLCIFALGTLLVFSAPPPKPFALLLCGVLVLILLIHSVMLVLYRSSLNTSQHIWQDRLQLLIFGAFHLQGLNQAPREVLNSALDVSESRPDGSQADQGQTDKQIESD